MLGRRFFGLSSLQQKKVHHSLFQMIHVWCNSKRQAKLIVKNTNQVLDCQALVIRDVSQVKITFERRWRVGVSSATGGGAGLRAAAHTIQSRPIGTQRNTKLLMCVDVDADVLQHNNIIIITCPAAAAHTIQSRPSCWCVLLRIMTCQQIMFCNRSLFASCLWHSAIGARPRWRANTLTTIGHTFITARS